MEEVHTRQLMPINIYIHVHVQCIHIHVHVHVRARLHVHVHVCVHVNVYKINKQKYYSTTVQRIIILTFRSESAIVMYEAVESIFIEIFGKSSSVPNGG